MKSLFFTVVILCLGTTQILAQGNIPPYFQEHGGDYVQDKITWQVKLLDEFRNRFNLQRTLTGEPYVNPDTSDWDVQKKYEWLQEYKNQRKAVILSLFDFENRSLDSSLIVSFADKVVSKGFKLSLYNDQWRAWIKVDVTYNDTPEKLMLLMRFDSDEEGRSRWMIQDVYADFLKAETIPEGDDFIIPVSHETNFMELDEFFKAGDKAELYMDSLFRTSTLQLFTEAVKSGQISFSHVSKIDYYFKQIPGYLFKVSFLNRPGMNSGWLISDLIVVDANSIGWQDLLIYYR